MKELYIIAGPNGAGKTTAALTLLPKFLKAKEYVNADSIAHALSPFNSEQVAIQAGKLMLLRIQELVKQNKDFAFETTLASKSFVHLLTECKSQGYQINMVFFWLHHVRLAMHRVKLRVSQGGHSIPVETIKRRYERGLKNFFNLYLPLLDNWWFYDNSGSSPHLVSEQNINSAQEIHNPQLWHLLETKYMRGV